MRRLAAAARGESGQICYFYVSWLLWVAIGVALLAVVALLALHAAAGAIQSGAWRLLWQDRANALYLAAVAVADAALTWFLGWAPSGWGKRSGWPRRRVIALAAFLFAAAALGRAAWVSALALHP